MDGGQVALSTDGSTQASVWMSDSAGSRKLFFSIGKPGVSPADAPPARLDGQQTHAAVVVLDSDRAVGIWEQDGNSVRVALLNRDGTAGKVLDLGQGKFPRIAATGDGVAAVWESDAGIRVRKLTVEDLK
ncbi:MAG: hypothetical protein HS108_15330 [Planctomycetes bacterium]|nr:hypothetical protein [Planctomycetota bacterium]